MRVFYARLGHGPGVLANSDRPPGGLGLARVSEAGVIEPPAAPLALLSGLGRVYRRTREPAPLITWRITTAPIGECDLTRLPNCRQVIDSDLATGSS